METFLSAIEHAQHARQDFGRYETKSRQFLGDQGPPTNAFDRARPTIWHRGQITCNENLTDFSSGADNMQLKKYYLVIELGELVGLTDKNLWGWHFPLRLFFCFFTSGSFFGRFFFPTFLFVSLRSIRIDCLVNCKHNAVSTQATFTITTHTHYSTDLLEHCQKLRMLWGRQ